MSMMKIGRSRSLMFTLLLSLTAPVASKTEQLTPAALIEQLAAANLELAAAEQATLQADATAQSKGRFADPKLTIGVAPKTFDSELGSRESIRISQALPWFGKRKLSKKVAEQQTISLSHQQAALKRELSLTGLKTWADWWFTHQALEINHNILSSYQRLTKSAQSRYENGQGKQQDALHSQVKLLHTQHQKTTLLEAKRRSAIELNTLRNRTPSAAVLPPSTLPAMPVLKDAQTYTAKLYSHPAYLAMLSQVEAADARQRIVARERYPDFVAEAAYIGTLDPEEKRWQVGLGLNIPFDQGKRRHQEAAAEAEKTKHVFSARSILLELEQRLGQLLSRYNEHQHIQHLYRHQLLPLAAQSQQAAQQDYANGISDLDTVTVAITEYQRTAMQLRRHQADQLMVLAELEQLLGQRLSE